MAGVVVPEVWIHMVKANVGLLFPIAISSLTSGSVSSSACPLGARPTMLTLNLGFQQTADGHEDHQPGGDAHRHGDIL